MFNHITTLRFCSSDLPDYNLQMPGSPSKMSLHPPIYCHATDTVVGWDQNYHLVGLKTMCSQDTKSIMTGTYVVIASAVHTLINSQNSQSLDSIIINKPCLHYLVARVQISQARDCIAMAVPDFTHRRDSTKRGTGLQVHLCI